MPAKTVFIIGGARSGKSTFAEAYVKRYGKKIAYIATAQSYDLEMKERIALHQQRRPETWTTYEAPFQAEQAIKKAACTGHDAILFDCISMYISNLLLSQMDFMDEAGRRMYVMANIEHLLSAAVNTQQIVVFVSNEVGMSIVPENALAREYRDLAGQANQKIAAAAAEAYAVFCGIALDLKRSAIHWEDENG